MYSVQLTIFSDNRRTFVAADNALEHILDFLLKHYEIIFEVIYAKFNLA